MSRVCEITGKKPSVANNVSHAMNKTKRRQLPNLQEKTFHSITLGRNVTLRVSTNAIRTIAKYGNIDLFMQGYKGYKTFSEGALKLRKAIKAKEAEAK
ncbi:MAG: 50S ribosomal protein L28 [Magnetococcales bacterium]|nr:50S ribosomal protein L28 [Magnetococcales bacterium]|tara:strand:+ start:425145 stop:425438 length:294 start_codon:yes stop_codon:yes gene_type:complete